jgi:signal transduction histidine kinase
MSMVNIFKPRNLQTKFILGLAAMMAVIGVFFVYLLQQYLRETLEQEARGKAQVILRGVESLHGYVQDNLRPAITGILLEDQGLLEAMSCTALARAAMGPSGQEGNEDYRFRRVAIGARSPDLEAAGLERSFIEDFQAQPARQWDEAFIKENGQEYLVMARPVRYQGFCLRCHGDPTLAPHDLVEAYGADRGFHRKEGELAGAHVVRLPMQATAVRIQGATLGFVLMFSLGALFLFAAIYFFFNRLVVHNLHRALTVMGRHFPEAASEAAASRPHPLDRSRDEIEQMLASMEQFAESLRQARAQLQSYAANLEGMVAGRTRELSHEAEARRADVALFVNLLNGLNHTADRKDILDGCLALVGKRFGASRVTFCCTMAVGASYSWPDQQAAAPMPKAWERMAARGETAFRDGCAYIPVRTSGAVHGLLTLCWEAERLPDPMPTGVLMAVGQQLGVVMENMDALDNLIRQNDLLHAVFEGISDPVALLDGGGRVVLANESSRQLAVSDVKDGRDAQTLLREALGIEAGKPLPADVLAGPSAREVKLPGDRTFLVSLYPLPEFRGRGGRLVAYAREVTGERRMRDLALQNEKLVAVGRLAAGLAHEINNPLGVILFYGELLKASAGVSESRDDVEVILRHTRQAQKVLRDLLDFVRPKKGADESCDLALVARRTASVFQVQASAEGVDLSVDAPEGLPRVKADTTSLEQILSNLIINALDAVVPGSGTIRVSAGLEHGQAVLRVADNGPGIAPENLGRIFDPFFTTKEVGKGTGLGLAVVFGLVNDMGGSVEAVSAAGAEFIVRLPLAGAKEADRDAA